VVETARELPLPHREIGEIAFRDGGSPSEPLCFEARHRRSEGRFRFGKPVHSHERGAAVAFDLGEQQRISG